VIEIGNQDINVPLSDEKEKLVLRGVVHENNVAFENVFIGYTRNK
jgi:hypothetical protein